MPKRTAKSGRGGFGSQLLAPSMQAVAACGRDQVVGESVDGVGPGAGFPQWQQGDAGPLGHAAGELVGILAGVLFSSQRALLQCLYGRGVSVVVATKIAGLRLCDGRGACA